MSKINGRATIAENLLIDILRGVWIFLFDLCRNPNHPHHRGSAPAGLYFDKKKKKKKLPSYIPTN